MSRTDCISNRNIMIISSYLKSRLGRFDSLFEGLTYPTDRYASPDDYFLNEDEWTTFENYRKIFRRAKEMSGEAYFYFNCGASSARLHSWGRFDYMVRIFSNPNDGFKRIPFFNRNFSDTNEIEIVRPPIYKRLSGKVNIVLKIRYHSDIDGQIDYLSDPYRRGMISYIPTLWGLKPAHIKQPLNPYDPEIVFNEDPEFRDYDLDVRMEGDVLTINNHADGSRRVIGKKVLLKPELVNGKKVFLGRYCDTPDAFPKKNNRWEALLITDTITLDGRIILKQGEIFKAPYFIMDVTYDRLPLVGRMAQIFKRRDYETSLKGLTEIINRLRETMEARNKAFHALKVANLELKEAKARLEEYNRTLEQKVEERTSELRKAQEELQAFNRGLEEKINRQVEELKRHDELRRYLSPKLTDKILSSGDDLGAEPQRKMMTVLFSDIRGFSTLTDSLEPEELFHLLDRYLSEMTKLIHQYDGTLNKIIGDGMLVFFGDPIPMKDHVRNAVMMAIDMQKKVAELRHEWYLYGYELGIGIGINSGFMTVGNIGSDMHMDYTVIGNQVNVASRLESLAKSGQILISQRTYSRVRDLVEVEEIGKIEVKGIHDPIVTFNVKTL